MMLVSHLDSNDLDWCRLMKLDAEATAQWIADTVRERTRDRAPGAHVIVITAA